MVITFTVSLKGHDTLVSYRADRMLVFDWVCRHVDDIDALELDCGLNRWSWTPSLGWTQYPQCVYTPGKGMHRADRKPIRRGNDYDAVHPWRYCAAVPIPNPFCAVVTETYVPF